MSDLPIVILAAGLSRRMRGRDKLMEEVDGQPLIRRQATMARRVTSGPVIVALPPFPHPRHDALNGVDVTLLPVPDAAMGMGISLRTAFAALPPDAPAAMLFLADLPALTDTDLARMLAAFDPSDPDTLVWQATTSDHQRGHPVIFSARLFPDIARLDKDEGAREIVKAAEGHVRHVALPGSRARLDLDTPEDWAAWRRDQGLP